MLSCRVILPAARATLVLFALCFGSGALSQGGNSTVIPTDDDPVAREVILVFDPRGNPPSAMDIVDANPSNSLVPSYRTLFGAVENTRLWYPIQLLSSDQAASLRATNPIAPELLFDQVIIVRYPPGTDVDAQLQRIKSDGRVLAAVRNFRMQFAVTPNDPYFAVNGGTPTDGIQGKYQWALTLLRFPQAWDRLKGTAYIADLDNGVYWQNGVTHADLQGNLRPHLSNWLFPAISGSTSVYYLDPNLDEHLQGSSKGHGTHVAGLMAATPNNSTGVAGGCWNCSFIEIGTGLDAASVGAALTEALRRGVQVINMSFAVSGLQYVAPSYCSQNSTVPPCNAITVAQNREVVLVAASGNDTYQVQFPANQPGVMAIGGLEFVDQTPTAAFWLHGYGDTINGVQHPVQSPPNDCTNTTQPNPFYTDTGSNCGSTQFLVAPAKDVLSTFYTGFAWNTDVHCADRAEPARQNIDGNWVGYLPMGYGDCTGTSMAAPHVSALAGLMRSANPLLTVSDIRRLMQRDASGNDTRIGDQWGYGYPIADNALISVLSGAYAGSPNLFDPNVKNKLTPLFSLYSLQGRNHFFSIAPQMAISAYNGTLIPSPRYKSNSSTYAAQCSNPCSLDFTPGSITPAIAILNPDGSTAGSNIGVHVAALQQHASPPDTYSSTGSGGTVQTNMSFGVGGGSDTLTVTPFNDFQLPYSIVGNFLSGNYLFPSLGTPGRSSVSVYVSHVNPLGSGPDLIPLYRLSWRCGDSANPACNTNPFHIRHAYTTNSSDVAGLQAQGFKWDGLEGYAFPTSYSSAPQSGMVKLCRLYDPIADEEILFPGTGTGGKNCYPPFPSYAPNSYYSATTGSSNWLGWVYPNYNGGTPPTVSITSPTNNATFNVGDTVTLKASANGSVSSVSYYGNGVLLGTKTSSPYQKNWVNVQAGTYILYAVALQGSTGLATTSAPITITVGSAPPPPTLGNNGFESPVVGSGTNAYVYGPTGASWTFTPAGGSGGSGVSGNNSSVTVGNPNAPFGSQVGFVQGATTIAQTVNFTAAGSYHITFYAAQRASNQNGAQITFNVLVDGTSYGAFTPTSINYAQSSSNAFSVGSGNHTITFQGLNPNGLDISFLLDNVVITSP